MSQTSYSLVPAIGTPGQVQDISQAHIVSVVAAEVIPFGHVVELDSNGAAVLPKSATLGKVVGISCLIDTRAQNSSGDASYAIGEMVPVLRKGRVFAALSGGTQGYQVAVNVKHGSSTPATCGKVSFSSTSASAGAEISALSGAVSVRSTGDSSLALVELNLPA